MQSLIRITLIAWFAVGCNHAAPSAPNDATSAVDGSTASGLLVTWSTTPAIPGDAGNSVTVTSATFAIEDLRVIGDAGTGDPRTSQTDFTITWSTGMAPPDITFADAPTGLYSKLTLEADGHLIDDSYEIDGTVVVNGTSHPFKVHDRDSISVNLTTSAMLAPGAVVRLPIGIRLDQALGVVDFSSVDDDGGMLDLDTFDAQMAAFRSKLIDSFAIVTETD